MRIPRKKKKFLKKGFIVYWGNMHIQYTMDNERRRTRCGLEAYEVVHWMCRDLLADQHRVMLYLVSDPDVNPDDYADGFALPVGALHLVMCATIAMIDALCKEVLVVQRDICSGLRDRFVRDLGRRWALCSFERVDFGPAIQKIRSLVAWLSELM